MGLTIDYEDGQTPLDEDEKEGLLIRTITTRAELDEVEQRNIEEAIRWTISRRRRFTRTEILSEEFICTLHKQMLSGVWQWVDKYQISMQFG